MIRIDPLYIMLLAEAVMLLVGLSVYLYIKAKRSHGGVEKSVIDITHLIEELHKEKEALEGKREVFEDERTDDTGILLHRKTFQMHHEFLKDMIETTERAEHTEIENLTEFLKRGIRETINRGILWVKEVIDAKDSRIAELEEELASREGTIEQMKAAFIKQKYKIADLLSSQEMLEQIQKRFDFLKERNKQLKEKLHKALSDKENKPADPALIEELETVNKELELCIETLEKENQRLQERLSQYENGINEMEENFTEFLTGQDTAVSGSDEADALRKELEEKEKELEQLKKDMEDLEKEYMVLYKQVNS